MPIYCQLQKSQLRLKYHQYHKVIVIKFLSKTYSFRPAVPDTYDQNYILLLLLLLGNNNGQQCAGCCLELTNYWFTEPSSQLREFTLGSTSFVSFCCIEYHA